MHVAYDENPASMQILTEADLCIKWTTGQQTCRATGSFSWKSDQDSGCPKAEAADLQ